jgi:transposase
MKPSVIKSLQRACEKVMNMNFQDFSFPTNDERTHYSEEYKRTVVQLSYIFGIRGTAAIVRASASSICRWRRRVTRKDRIGQSKITELMVQSIKEYMQSRSNDNILANDVKSFIKETFDIEVSRQLVQIIISKRLNISYKRTRSRGREVGRDDEYETRKNDFITKLSVARSENRIVVSIDESGFDQRSRPSYGYAEKGKIAIRYKPTVKVSDHRRTSLLMALGSDGSKVYQKVRDTIKGDLFADFILDLPFPPGSVIILDNHSMHDIESVQVAMVVKEYVPLFVPPQSPEFNPIEQFFGTIQVAFRRFRYKSNFSTVSNAIDEMIEKYGSAESIRKYFTSIYDYIETVQILDIAVQYENTNCNSRWNGYRTGRVIST